MSTMQVPFEFGPNGEVIRNDAAKTRACNTYSESNPLPMVSASCHRSQVEEYREFAKRNGITGMKWNEKGDCYCTSRQDRRKYHQLAGRRDNDAGFSD